MVLAHIVFGAVLGALVQPRLPWSRPAVEVEVRTD
jgi:hypothetical protein